MLNNNEIISDPYNKSNFSKYQVNENNFNLNKNGN